MATTVAKVEIFTENRNPAEPVNTSFYQRSAGNPWTFVDDFVSSNQAGMEANLQDELDVAFPGNVAPVL